MGRKLSQLILYPCLVENPKGSTSAPCKLVQRGKIAGAASGLLLLAVMLANFVSLASNSAREEITT